MKQNILFVTGTDTGVGKTFVSSALVSELVAKGIRVTVCKPLESGIGQEVSDAELLWRAQGETQDRSSVCLYEFKTPVTPSVAARLEGVATDAEKIISHIIRLSAESDLVVVEGAGGLLAPLVGGLTLADIGEKVGAAFLIVVGSRLGAINHTALTLEVLRARKLSIVGYVLNEVFESDTESAAIATNRAAISDVASSYEVAEVGIFPASKRGEKPEISTLVSAIVLRFLSW